MKYLRSLHKKTISMHPFATIGAMCVFAYPAVAISHATDNLATHKHIRNTALGFSVAFFAFFTIILLLQLAAELEKIKDARNYSIPGLLFGFIIFGLGFCVAVGGAVASSIIIKVLDSGVPAQAKVISQQTAAVNYFLVSGVLLMLIGYALTHYSMGPVDKEARAPLVSAEAMKRTSSLWFLCIMGLGTAGAFTLKSASQISHNEIVTYSAILFFSAVVIGMPKIVHALNQHIERSAEGHPFPTKLYWSLFLPLIGFGLFGAGITAAIYGDPLYGAMLVVAGMLPLALAGRLSDCVSNEMLGPEQLGSNSFMSDHSRQVLANDEQLLTNAIDNDNREESLTVQ